MSGLVLRDLDAAAYTFTRGPTCRMLPSGALQPIGGRWPWLRGALYDALFSRTRYAVTAVDEERGTVTMERSTAP
jgi:hypothetical protein